LLSLEPIEIKIVCYFKSSFAEHFVPAGQSYSRLWLFPRNQAMYVTFVESAFTVRMSKQITCSCILGRDHSAVHTVVKLLHSSQIWAPILPRTQLMLVISRLSSHALNVARSFAIAALSPCTGDVPGRFRCTKFGILYHTCKTN